MATAGFVVDDSTRIDVDTSVKAQFTAQAKQQAAAQAIVAAFNNPQSQLQLARNGTPLLPLTMGTVPTVVGQQVIWTAQILTSQLADFDIDAGTWTAVIKSPSGRTITPSSVGKTTGVLRISADIEDGPKTVSVSLAIDMPAFGEGGGGGGAGGGGGSFVAGTPPGGFTGWTAVLTAAQSAFTLPADFYGWHRDTGMGPPQFNFKLNRSWDYDNASGAGGCLWAYINPQQGQYNWGFVDDWIANSPNQTRMFTVSWTPEWATDPSLGKTPSQRYPGFRYGAYAPVNMAYLTTFVQALYARYSVAQIPFIEVWNEPETGSNTDPSIRNANPGMAFYADTMTKLVQMARTINLAVPAGVTVLGCGWEGDSNYGNNSTLFMKTSTGSGTVGGDEIDGMSIHPYEYSYQYNRTWVECQQYRAQLVQLSTELSKPAWATMPLYCTETGHEAPDGFNGLASSTDENTVARGMKQMVGFAVASAIAHGNKMQILYADKTNPRTFRGPINSSAVLKAAAEYCNWSNGGKVIRQCYIKPQGNQNPAVWIRDSNNVEFVA